MVVLCSHVGFGSANVSDNQVSSSGCRAVCLCLACSERYSLDTTLLSWRVRPCEEGSDYRRSWAARK